jgi:demethylmenaquinone methyltransferase / 2-methoxy-6-polyprenyl-1,4-benzoquinol methylase
MSAGRSPRVSAEPLPQGKDKSRRVRDLFDGIAGRYDLVNRIMTLGMDLGWRRRAVRELRLPGGAVVLDLACGTGDLCEDLIRSGYSAIGVDFSLRMLARARSRLAAPLVAGDVLRLPVRDGAAGGAVSGFALRNVVSLDAMFGELARVVRPSGRIALLDASRPDRAVLRAAHRAYLERVVPAIGGLLSNAEAYAYLPKSMAYLPEPATIVGMLRAEGFVDVRRVQLSAGIVQLITGTRA